MKIKEITPVSVIAGAILRKKLLQAGTTDR